jgi:hypothetical protein
VRERKLRDGMIAGMREGAAMVLRTLRRSMAERLRPDPRQWTIAGWASVAYLVSLSVALVFFREAFFPTYLVAFPVLQAAKWWSNRAEQSRNAAG